MERQNLNGNSNIPNLFLPLGPILVLRERSAAKKINLPGAELRVGKLAVLGGEN